MTDRRRSLRNRFSNDSRRLGFGGAVSIVGGPAGSITIEGWTRSEVEVNTEVQLQAPSVAELDRLARINGFAIDEDANHIRILTTGTHDKKYLKRACNNCNSYIEQYPEWAIEHGFTLTKFSPIDKI